MLFNLEPPFNEFSRVFPTPNIANSDIWSRLCNQWFWHLGHYARTNDLGVSALKNIIKHLRYFKAYQRFWMSININNERWAEFENFSTQGYHQTKFPSTAPEDIANCVAWLQKNIGQIKTPVCFKRGKANYSRLWLSIILYGNNGRTFPFARNRITKAFASTGVRINAKTVQTFLKMAEKNNFVTKIRKGRSWNPKCRTGNETTFGSDCYKLTTKALSEVPSFLNLTFKTHLMSAAPWIIKKGN